MRVIGGTYRGKKLITPENDQIRPTSDRMRETLFNILEHGAGPGIRGSRMLDLFAGSGALGIEALSRGADHVAFVDRSPQSMQLIRQNTALIKSLENTTYLTQDATHLAGNRGPFDIIFIDPPYHKELITPSLENIHNQELLSEGGLIITEYATDEAIDFTGFFEEIKNRKMGEARFSILKRII